MQCIITGKQPNQLTNCDETMKRALNTQTVRAKENPPVEPWLPSLSTTPGTNLNPHQKQPNRVTNCDERKKRALNTQTVRAKENPPVEPGLPSLRKIPGTDINPHLTLNSFRPLTGL